MKLFGFLCLLVCFGGGGAITAVACVASVPMLGFAALVCFMAGTEVFRDYTRYLSEK